MRNFGFALLYLPLKRAWDLVLSGISLIALSPILVLLALLVRWQLGSPILFAQVRPGRDGTPFTLIKFRTMREERDEEGGLLPNSQRMTRFGQFLRSYSLDELPELWNVFKGEMSIVGPRPLLMDYLPLYSESQARRHEVPPGLTGWAQVNGRNALTWEEKFELDVWYVDHASFWLDLKIIAMTVFKVLRREGITHAGDVAMPRFRGSQSHDH